MKRYSFPYYRSFACMAEDCPMICCGYFRIYFFDREARQFDTRPEWQDMDGQGHGIRDFVVRKDNEWVCRSREEGGCIFFENKLCSIQKNISASAMPSVCRTYPRIITRFANRVEYALDPCCPVAVNLTQDWNIGEFAVSGDGPNPDDADFLRRERAFTILRDKGISLSEALQKLADEYDTGHIIPQFCLNATHEGFLRKVAAFFGLSIVLPYEGYPDIPNIAGWLLDFLVGFIPKLEASGLGDWWQMSCMFSRELVDAEIRDRFDGDIEERYIDVNEENLQ